MNVSRSECHKRRANATVAILLPLAPPVECFRQLTPRQAGSRAGCAWHEVKRARACTEGQRRVWQGGTLQPSAPRGQRCRQLGGREVACRDNQDASGRRQARYGLTVLLCDGGLSLRGAAGEQNSVQSALVVHHVEGSRREPRGEHVVKHHLRERRAARWVAVQRCELRTSLHGRGIHARTSTKAVFGKGGSVQTSQETSAPVDCCSSVMSLSRFTCAAKIHRCWHGAAERQQ